MKQYKAVKMIWRPEYYGSSIYERELAIAKQSCISDIIVDFSQDTSLEKVDTLLLTKIISNYANVTLTTEGCFKKILMEVSLDDTSLKEEMSNLSIPANMQLVNIEH